jgi:hypothetical protein
LHFTVCVLSFDKNIMAAEHFGWVVHIKWMSLMNCNKIKVLTSVPLFWYDNFLLRVLNIAAAVKSVWYKQGELSQVLHVLPHLGCLNYLAWLHTLSCFCWKCYSLCGLIWYLF